MYALMSHRLTIYITASILSLLLSLGISGTQQLINPDAVCYLTSAERLSQGLHYAMNVCGQAKWPLYSILISGVQTITHLSYTYSAYVLNASFSLLTVCTFISIVSFLRESLTTNRMPELSYHKGEGGALLWFAAFTILLCHEFNSAKHEIIRDHGYWAFYLLSILYLMCFLRVHQWRYALAFSVSMIFAALFRIEGAIFLLAVPFVTWFQSGALRARCKHFLQLYALTLCAGIAMLGWLIFHPDMSLGRLGELQLSRFFHLAQVYQGKVDALSTYVLNMYSVRHAEVILFFTLLAWYLFAVIANVSLIFTILIIYTWCKKIPTGDFSSRWVLRIFVAVNVILTLAFLFENMFFSKRYLVGLTLVFLVWAPFALNYLLSEWNNRKWPLILSILLILAASLGGIVNFGHSKVFVRSAGEWVSENVPASANVYSNDLLIMYYSKHFGDSIFNKNQVYHDLRSLSDGNWKNFDYLVIRVNKKEADKNAAILNSIPLKPVRIFSNKRGDQVRIYRR
jgi:hypothetical protein